MRLSFFVLPFFLFCLAAGSSIAQSDAIEAIIEEHDEAMSEYKHARREANMNPEKGINADSIPHPEIYRRFWFYPSTVRALNLTNDSLWNALSLGLDQVVVMTAEKMSSNTWDQLFKRIGNELQKEGFDVWMQMSGKQKAALYVKEDDGIIEHFVLIASAQGGRFVVDFEGELTPQQMMDIRNMDLEKLQQNFAGSGILSLME